MSLDVWLKLPTKEPKQEPAIYIREDGQTKAISREEWDERFPGREPVVVEPLEEHGEVWGYNITHNLTDMASEAGIYKHLWRPEEMGIERAKDLIDPLRDGLAELVSDPERFKQHNPENGWGDYDGLVAFVKSYLEACQKWPEAEVGTWR